MISGLRILAIFAWALYLAHPFTTASNANGYQVALAWYAYLMDLEVGAGLIAPGCKNCDLDTFLRYNEKNSNGKPRANTGLSGPWTGEGALSVNDIANIIQGNGFTSDFDRDKLLPNAPPLKASKQFGHVFLELNDRVQILRLNLPADDERVTRMSTAAQSALQARNTRPDLTIKERDTLNKISAKGGYGFTAIISSDGLSIDTLATINTIPQDAAGVRDAKAVKAVESFAMGMEPGGGVTLNSKDRTSITHNKVKVDLGNIISDLSSAVVGCAKEPKSRRRLQTGVEERFNRQQARDSPRSLYHSLP